MQKKNHAAPETGVQIANAMPDAGDFRGWLRAALPAVGLSAGAVCERLDLGKNTLGDFIGKPGRDIRLSNAARVHRHLTAAAAAKGVDLPEIGGQANG